MRPLWSGSLSFGLINIPVNLYSASNDIGIDLTMLHKADHAPIKYMRVCSRDGKEVPWDQIVRGYEIKEGDFVVLTEEELKKVHAKKQNTIDILQFAEERTIDTIYDQKPYYLEPKKGAEKAYALLREALRKSGKVGIATFVLRTRQHLAAVKTDGDAIILEQLRFESEIRKPKDLKFPAKSTVNASELKIALTLINQLTKAFNPKNYRDTFTEDLKKIIAAKSKGKRPVIKGEKAKPDTKVEDIMTLLKKSLGESKKIASLSK